ncbi:MAG: hypothetical protein ABJG78_03575 [Cyclobacteriaceae bacterium]
MAVKKAERHLPNAGSSFFSKYEFKVICFGPEEEDGKRRVIGNDGWILAVEFGKKIKANGRL